MVEEEYDPTRVIMITEDVFPYATTTESHYAKEDTETMQVRQLVHEGLQHGENRAQFVGGFHGLIIYFLKVGYET